MPPRDLFAPLTQPPEGRVYSVSEFNEFINGVLAVHPVVVEGEISRFEIRQQRLIFFTLVDKKSTVDCFAMIWDIDAPLELCTEGAMVRVYGVPGLYVKSGRFRINVKRLELAGEGALRRAYELLKARLAKEGLFDIARKRILPRYPRRIGLITSRDAAAYSDFLKILRERWGGLEILFINVAVQGVGAVPQIVRAIEAMQRENIDVMVITRGGGSLEDLAAFNSEKVARAVFSSRIPVVVGVGHERDESLADFVADVRASTPSNAAELIVPHRREVRSEVIHSLQSMERTVEARARADMRKNFIIQCGQWRMQ